MLRVDSLKIRNLAPISFDVSAGACLAVMGPSGSGKTLLLRAIADLDPAEGQVFLDGEERNEMPATVWRRAVRYVQAEPGWWAETPRPHFDGRIGDDHTERGRERVALFASLGLRLAQLDQPLATLSTGERQRLALARGLEGRPRALLLDEPTAALDDAGKDLVEALLIRLLEARYSIVLATHDEGQARRVAGATLRLEPSDRFAHAVGEAPMATA